jgi:hypothetical protein
VRVLVVEDEKKVARPFAMDQAEHYGPVASTGEGFSS